MDVVKLCGQLMEASKHSRSCSIEIAAGLRELRDRTSLEFNRSLDDLTPNIANTQSSSSALTNRAIDSVINPYLKDQVPQPGRPKNSSRPVERIKSSGELYYDNKRKYHCLNNCGKGPYSSSSALSLHKRKCLTAEPKETLD
jgi:hypothetical protein